MNARVLNAVSGRLSLRAPQAESLQKLAMALEAAPDMLQQDRDINAILACLKAEFPTLEDFEREFPSLCFSLATGVGKTRLMGAFISYLYLAHGISNFFVLAPNLTIYDKLITDFTPNTSKYVFKGIAEFAQQSPEIITGDNYEQRGATAMSDILSPVRINIFNISKINSEVRGGKSPRIKRLSEYLGDSYFNYLAELPDLVLLMDESHRYRASAGVRAINELRPLFGLEVTATPFVEVGSGKTVSFKNVVMDYPLARAMEDGFIKEPAVVTQRNFDARQHSSEEVEKIKLEDGVRLHETTKVELQTYAHENDVKLVKPFMLVIARDTTHAASLKSLIEEKLFDGRYKDKVIQVDSSRSGAEEEEMIRRLLAVESVDEPTEIVIHVNMLKEGWDVTNLYTIVPLRAANARTLIEQSIGRGLRLPYGKRTGVDAVDRLNIVAHDRFQEIIDDANRADSLIRLKQVILESPDRDERKVSVQVESNLMASLGLSQAVATTTEPGGNYTPTPPPKPHFVSEPEIKAAQAVVDIIRRYETRTDITPNSVALLQEHVQKELVAAVEEQLRPVQASLLVEDKPLDIAAVVAKATAIVVQQRIDIPRITLVPKGEVTTGFHPFTVDLSALKNLQPREREIVGQMLQSNKQFTLASGIGIRENRLEDYIVRALVDYDDIDYFTHADLLYNLAGQVVAHLRSYLSEEDARNILDGQGGLIAENLHAQMMMPDHFWEKVSGYDVTVSRGFTELKPCSYTAAAGQLMHHYRETVVDVSRIKQMLFGGFEKCLYPFQKFDSDTERRFVVILERDALKWFKPARGQFQIYYKLGSTQPEYIPDFVAETNSEILMAETKARGDLDSAEVQAKANAAAQWCQHASQYAKSIGAKPWRYLLMPHDDVRESLTLRDYLRFEFRGA